MITTQWLSDEIVKQLNEQTTLKNVVVSYSQNSIIIDWNYTKNSKFDIFDGQKIVDELVKQYDADVSWSLADKHSIITL